MHAASEPEAGVRHLADEHKTGTPLHILHDPGGDCHPCGDSRDFRGNLDHADKSARPPPPHLRLHLVRFCRGSGRKEQGNDPWTVTRYARWNKESFDAVNRLVRRESLNHDLRLVLASGLPVCRLKDGKTPFNWCGLLPPRGRPRPAPPSRRAPAPASRRQEPSGRRPGRGPPAAGRLSTAPGCQVSERSRH